MILVALLLLFVTTNIHGDTGWKAVEERGVFIDVDLENSPLEIKTNSTLGSGDEIKIKFIGDQGDEDHAAGLVIRFGRSLSYRPWRCFESETNNKDFPVVPPSETEKIWKIQRISAEIRLVIHCNKVEVLNVVLSEETCDTSDWNSARWEKTVTKIRFGESDTASDFYRSSPTLGWKKVIKDVYIDFDMERTPLEIKTGTGNKLRVGFRNNQAVEDFAGYVVIVFPYPPKYQLGGCNEFQTLPATLPTETNTVWRITLSRTSGGRRVVIQCNDVELVNVVVSETTCNETNWSTIWKKDVTGIFFNALDTASDQYRFVPVCPELNVPDAIVTPSGGAIENDIVTVTCLSPHMNQFVDKEVTCQSTGWVAASGTLPKCITEDI
ncbi:hypothetical protein ACHWQZ_G019481 [Mnemiopsis leidyi]